MKHIHLKYYFVKNCVAGEEIVLLSVLSNENIVDMLSKILDFPTMKHLSDLMCLFWQTNILSFSSAGFPRSILQGRGSATITIWYPEIWKYLFSKKYFASSGLPEIFHFRGTVLKYVEALCACGLLDTMLLWVIKLSSTISFFIFFDSEFCTSWTCEGFSQLPNYSSTKHQSDLDMMLFSFCSRRWNSKNN